MRAHEGQRDRPEFHRIAIRCFKLVCVRFWIGQVGSHIRGGKSFFVLPEALPIASRLTPRSGGRCWRRRYLWRNWNL